MQPALAGLLLLALSGWNCNKDRGEVLFQLGYPNNRFEIKAGLSTFETHYFLIRNIPANYLAFLDQYGASDAEVTSIEPRAARLTALSSGFGFDFINDIYIEIFPDGKPEERREIFYRENLPLNTDDQVDLIPSYADLKEFFREHESFTLQVRLFRLRTPSPAFIECRLDVSFNVRGG